MIITVVTPTLNGARFLRECIESVRRNESRSVQIEHVVVDGGSTDGTVELARSYGLRVMQGKDKGIYDAINKGSFDSCGELIGCLNSDDVMLPGALEAIAQAYQRTGRRWIVGGIHWLDDKDRDLGTLAAPPAWMTARMLVCLGWSPVMHMATYFSREFFTALGGFNIEFREAGDYDMFARALIVSPYARLAHPVACFRRTGVNSSVLNLGRSSQESRRVLDSYGPASELERALWRYALKGWFNLANPRWLLWKLGEPARLRLGLQERAHF